MAGLFDRLQDEIARRDEQAGLSPADLLAMSPELQALVQVLLRQGAMTAEEVAAAADMPVAEVVRLLDDLVAKGLARLEPGEVVRHYRVQLGRRRAREVPLDIWEALAEKTEPEAGDP